MGLDEIKFELFDARDGAILLEDLGMVPPERPLLPGQRPPRGRGDRGRDRRPDIRPGAIKTQPVGDDDDETDEDTLAIEQTADAIDDRFDEAPVKSREPLPGREEDPEDLPTILETEAGDEIAEELADEDMEEADEENEQADDGPDGNRVDHRDNRDNAPRQGGYQGGRNQGGRNDNRGGGYRNGGRGDQNRNDQGRGDQGRGDQGRNDQGRNDQGRNDNRRPNQPFNQPVRNDGGRGGRPGQNRPEPYRNEPARRPDQRNDQARTDQGRNDQGRNDQGRNDQGRSDQGRNEPFRPNVNQPAATNEAGVPGEEGGPRRRRRRRGRRNRGRGPGDFNPNDPQQQPGPLGFEDRDDADGGDELEPGTVSADAMNEARVDDSDTTDDREELREPGEGTFNNVEPADAIGPATEGGDSVAEDDLNTRFAEAPAADAAEEKPKGRSRSRRRGKAAPVETAELTIPADDADAGGPVVLNDADATLEETPVKKKGRPKRVPPPKKGRPTKASKSAEPAEGPVVRTGSADKHLADEEDEPVIPQALPQPGSYTDLDAIPDDYD